MGPSSSTSQPPPQPIPSAAGGTHFTASPGPNDRGSNSIFCCHAGEAQRAVLAIKFVKNVIPICADPIFVETSNGQRSSIRKGKGLGRIINYKIQVLIAPRRRVSGRRTCDNDRCRGAMQICFRQRGLRYNHHEYDHSASGQPPVRQEAHGRSLQRNRVTMP